jgi:hypothetical protein
MSRPRLTLVTVTKDDHPGLVRTLASSASLRAAGAEHLVIDGGAGPAAAETVAAAAGGPGRVIRRAPHGIADAFNAGLAEAQGEWVWFLNGGDAVHESLDAAWLLAFLAATRADVVAGMLHFDGEAEPRPPAPLAYRWPLVACWPAHPATLVRRQRLQAAGGFDSRRRIAMDYDLWFRLFGRDAGVDVLSVPLARFDRQGLSERPETAAAARRETAAVVLAHAGRMAGQAGWLGLRVARRIAWAACRWLFPGGSKDGRP